MITSIPDSEIFSLLKSQLRNFFTLNKEEEILIDLNRDWVMKKLENCFAPNPNKYYHRDGETYFNPFHSAQYTIFLYLMSREIFLNGRNFLLADKIYYLNKALNGCDLFYEIELPEYFKLDHPVGTVIGRAKYGYGFSFTQCCTVGNNNGVYPEIEENVRMCANSSIIGNCHIGRNVIIGANSGVKDCDVPDNTIVFGQYPNNVFKLRKQ